MSVKFELNFVQNLIIGKGSCHLNSDHEKCHIFSLKDTTILNPASVELVPGKYEKNAWLYGPAMDIKSRKIIYPCSRYKCSIPCPCLLCSKQHPKCREPSKSCSCDECYKHFEDHSSFHGIFHFGCRSCFQIVQKIPHFNFFFLSPEMNKHGIGSNDEIPIKPLVVELEPQAPKTTLKILKKFRDGKWADVGAFRCTPCGAIYWSMPQLREHTQLNHLVSKTFRHNFNFQGGTKLGKKNEIIEFKCYQCSTFYSSSSNLNRHIEDVHYAETYDCQICTKTFKRSDNLIRHNKNMHKTNEDEDSSEFECEECGKQFNRQDNLNRHKLVHCNSDSKFKCEICNTEFTKKIALDRHKNNIANSDGSLKNKCSECMDYFCTSKLLRSHYNSNHRNLSCEKCGQIFTRKKSLDDHVKIRSDVSCSECGKLFCNMNSVYMHKNKVHNDVDYIKCDLCENKYLKTFLKSHKLWTHNIV